MDELLRDVEKARPYLREPEWQPSEAPSLNESVGRRSTAAKRVAAWGIPAAAALAAGLVLWSGAIGNERQVAQTPAAEVEQPSSVSVTLSDGSRAFALGAGTQVHVEQDTAQLALVRLDAGEARFEVVPNPGRRFRVRAGNVSVQALGTVFAVQLRADEQVRVRVSEGRVRVEWSEQQVELSAGQEGLFPREQLPATEPTAETSEQEPRAAAPAPVSWQKLARSKQFDAAYDALSKSHPKDVPAELMLAADVARQAGHPATAAKHLERVAFSHGGDPRAPVASVTLGRVYLELGRANSAAKAFHQAQVLAPGGVLSETAASYEVDALARAGQKAAARAKAKRFLAKYPKSSRANRVRKVSGLE